MVEANLPDKAHPVKARIVNLENITESIECLFNPSEYTFSKGNTWTPGEVKGKDLPELEFGGGKSTTLKMQLFFDTYASGEDVRDYTLRIWKLMKIDEKLTDMTSIKGRPPLVEFHWGNFISFKGVITDISQKYTLFRDDGTPVRATLDVSFLQAKEEERYPGQNPTTMGQPGYKRRVVRERDTIDWIAFDEYGDSAMWRFVAETNNLENPRRLKPGQVLAIAPPP
jgi:hypothetical protein